MHRYPLSLAAGLALWLAFPSHNLWWLAPLGVAVLALATRGAGARRGFVVGLICGLGCFLPLLSWSGVYVGDVPWVALAAFEALYVALMGAAAGWLQTPRRHQLDRRHQSNRVGSGSRAPVRPIAVALLWVAQEALRGRAPFGGFPWGRLAFSQTDSPLVRLASLGGAPLVTFAVALCGALVAAAVAALAAEGAPRPIRIALRVAAPLIGAAALLTAPLLVPLPTAGREAQVMAVQGNVPQAGLDFNAQRRAVLDDHVSTTEAAAASVRAGNLAQPDLVLWPENSSDIDPLINPDAAERIREATDAVKVPILFGAVLEQPLPDISNASLLSVPGKGITQRYVKRHPVPFAEYIPLRSFFRIFSSKVDLVREDFVAGRSVGVFRVPTATDGTIAAGAVICFEVAYDDLVRDNVTAGANLIVVQTNNATFGYTDESVQQLAISRLRAIEHGRSVVHVSTVGVSALITPDGVAHQSSALFTSAVLSGELPLRSQLSIADRVGSWPELLACLIALILLVRRSAFSPVRALSSAHRRRGGANGDGQLDDERPGRWGGRADSDLQRDREPAADR